MAYISFTFENTNGDQTFEYDDEIDTTRNPIVVGPINSGDTSGPLQCWAGGDGKGKITLRGSVGPALYEDIDRDGYNFRY